jgi:stringent starvation protein B
VTPKDAALALLERGLCSVHFAPAAPGVVVPLFLRGSPVLCLDFGLNLPTPIRDLSLDELGIRGTLSFSGAKHWCDIPWTAVFALTNGAQGPAAWLRASEAPEAPAPPPEPVRKLGHLTLLKGGKQ